jgi:hypothetical protein
MIKKSRSGSGMNVPDHISESLQTIFWDKKTEILLCGSRSGIFLIGDPGWKKFESGINNPAKFFHYF